ncbi:MAG: hypothetical protein JWO31_575 [Phycisphaerales bacterium]|nr:hypothetical protein [Phycisphaerales bacterium]
MARGLAGGRAWEMNFEDPLRDLMLSTHTCTPRCGCSGDFVITPRAISRWIDEFGVEFGHVALGQVDALLSAGQAGGSAWLLRWRVAIDEALRADIADAEADRATARRRVREARMRWAERERRAIGAARQYPAWRAAKVAAARAASKRRRANDDGTRARAYAETEAARRVIMTVEDACRLQDPAHRAAAASRRAAEDAVSEAERRLKRARAAKPVRDEVRAAV